MIPRMQRSTVTQPDTSRLKTAQRSTRADTDTNEPYVHHYRSVITPDLVSADALIPVWLRNLFRRTPASP